MITKTFKLTIATDTEGQMQKEKEHLSMIYGAEEQESGRWIDDKCSICEKGIEDLISSREWYRNEEPNFCPFCGAKMKAESEETE